MSDPFIAQITLFAGNFAPSGWAFCSGQILSIAQNTALFSLVGTTYGGNGETTFGLPDLRGRSPRGSHNNSAGPGLPGVNLGEKGGSVQHLLTTNQLPSHSHTLQDNALEVPASQTEPGGYGLGIANIYAPGTPDARTGPASTNPVGANLPVNHLDPYLGLNYLIALFGIFPSPN